MAKHHLCSICHDEAQVVRSGKWFCLSHQTHRLEVKGELIDPEKHHCYICKKGTIAHPEADGHRYCHRHSKKLCATCGQQGKVLNEGKWYCDPHNDQMMKGFRFSFAM